MDDFNFININKEALSGFIKNEVEILFKYEVENMKKYISDNLIEKDTLLSREDVAQILDVSLGTIDNLRKKNKLHSYRIGLLVRFKNSEIQEYIKQL